MSEMNVNVNEESKVEDKTSAIDRALAAAMARKAARDAGVESTSPSTMTLNEKIAKAIPSNKSNAEAKAQRQVERETTMVTRKAERAARKAAKAAEDADKRPVHMAKVARAASKLPQLNTDASDAFATLTTKLATDQIAALALHLQHHNRVAATQNALAVKMTTGTAVRIVGGDPRFIGKTGVVSKAQRIRCYVAIEGVAKPVYCFTSDVNTVA